MTLEALLQQQKIPYEKLSHRKTFTAQDLAASQHVSGYRVAKPVLVRGDRGYALCVLAACDHVDLARAGQALGDSHVRLASEQEMAQVFRDCELGAEPPVGSLYNLPTVMDERLADDEFLLMQAGTHTEAVQIRREDWERLCKPIHARIAR